MEDQTLAIEKQAALSAIKLPEDAVKGLMPIQIQAMKETAVDVNANMSTAGRAIAASAKMLYELKANLKHGNWGAFIKSNALSISERAAIDLVSTYENWLSKEQVREDLLATMTPRTLSVLASASPDKRNAVLARIIGGEQKPTEQVVRQLIKGITPKKKGEGTREKLIEAGGKLVIENQAIKKTSVEQLVALSEENEALKEENKKLKARIKELEADLAKV